MPDIAVMDTTYIAVAGSVTFVMGILCVIAWLNRTDKGYYAQEDNGWYQRNMTWCGTENTDPKHRRVRTMGLQLPWEFSQVAMICALIFEAAGTAVMIAPAVTEHFSAYGPTTSLINWQILWYFHFVSAAVCWIFLVFLQFYDPTPPCYSSTTAAGNMSAREEYCGIKMSSDETESSPLLTSKDEKEMKEKGKGKNFRALPWSHCKDCDKLGRPPFVPGRYRYHCRWCNRCVIGFDHHCEWLNICICAANYKQWIWFIIGLVSKSFTQVAIGVCCIYEAEEDRLKYWTTPFWQATLVIFASFLSVVSFFIGCFATSLLVYQALMKIQQARTGEFNSTYTWLKGHGRYHDDSKKRDDAVLRLRQLLVGMSLVAQGPVTFETRKGRPGPLWMTLPPGPERRAERLRFHVRAAQRSQLETDDNFASMTSPSGVTTPRKKTQEVSRVAQMHSAMLQWKLQQTTSVMEATLDADELAEAASEGTMTGAMTRFLSSLWGSRMVELEEDELKRGSSLKQQRAKTPAIVTERP